MLMWCAMTGKIRTMVSSPIPSKYTVLSICFCDNGASVVVCTLETHKMSVFCWFVVQLHTDSLDSDCYSIEPWTLKWSKQIRTRMCVFRVCYTILLVESQCSAHANLMDNFLAIVNLHDGIDLYSFPNMHLIKTYSHGNMNDAIFKVSLMDKHWLVSSG